MLLFRSILTLLVLLALPVHAFAAEWSLPPQGYTYKPAPACLEDPVRAVKPIRPRGAVYRLCDDQMQHLVEAIAEARREQKLLIVTIGATWCPWCAALQRLMPGPEFFARKGDAVDYAHTYKHIEIGLSATYKGRNAIIPSGDGVVKALLARSGGVPLKAIPFLVMIDPDQPDRVFARNMINISDEAKGEQDMAGFRKIVAEGHAFLKAARADGRPAPAR